MLQFVRPLLIISLGLIVAGSLWCLKLTCGKPHQAQAAQRRTGLFLSSFGAGLFIWVATLNVQGAMRLAYVDSAIGTLRNITASEEVFANGHPQQGFTCNFADFSSGEVLLALAKNSVRNGYSFEIRGCESAIPNRRYEALAFPLHTDMQSFCINESGVLNASETGSRETCPLRGTPLQ